MASLGIRDLLAAISPTWLQSATGEADTVGSKIVYTFGLGSDLELEKLQQGMKAHMPTVCTPTALQYIGEDRVIERGFQETDTAYGLRLQRAFETWQHAGSAGSVIGSLLGYISPDMPSISTVSDRSVWYTVLAGSSTPAYYASAPFNWRWDGGAYDDTQYYRAWVIIGPGVWVKNDTWGTAGRKWGDRIGTWGSNASRQQVLSVQSIVSTWKAAQADVPWIIVNFDTTMFNPYASFGSPSLPDGYWGNWHKVVAGVAVPARSLSAIYWDGVE